jgi:phosphoglycerate dehydrogenase-like enzyme
MDDQKHLGRPLRLLLSVQAQQAFSDGIRRALDGMPYELVTAEDVLLHRAPGEVDIAFISRDVTGKSSKTDLTESLRHFYTVLRASPCLQWVHGHSAGADRPIYPALRARGVAVTTSSGANADAVAQMVLAAVLTLGRRLPDLMRAQQQRAWRPLLGERTPRDLRGQTAVVVGMGPIGQEVARLLHLLHMKVIGVRRSNGALTACDDTISLSRIDDVLPQADWLVLACPLTDATRGLVNARRINLLPASAHVINVARGEVAIEADLADALASGRLAGAFLDVFETEPLDVASPLWAIDNVIVSPHSAGHTSGHYAAVGEIFLDNLARWRSHQAMRNRMA